MSQWAIFCGLSPFSGISWTAESDCLREIQLDRKHHVFYFLLLHFFFLLLLFSFLSLLLVGRGRLRPIAAVGVNVDVAADVDMVLDAVVFVLPNSQALFSFGMVRRWCPELMLCLNGGSRAKAGGGTVRIIPSENDRKPNFDTRSTMKNWMSYVLNTVSIVVAKVWRALKFGENLPARSACQI